LITMLGKDRIAAYRAMSQEERWREVEQLMTLAWRSLQHLPPEEIQRRLDRDRQEHDRADEIMLAHLRRVS